MKQYLENQPVSLSEALKVLDLLTVELHENKKRMDDLIFLESFQIRIVNEV